MKGRGRRANVLKPDGPLGRGECVYTSRPTLARSSGSVACPAQREVKLRACTHKSAICKRGLVSVRLAPKATEVLRCRETSLCAMCGRLRVGKKNLHVAKLVGAAMCSAFRCGSHDRWP